MIALLAMSGCLTTIYFPPDLWEWDTAATAATGGTFAGEVVAEELDLSGETGEELRFTYTLPEGATGIAFALDGPSEFDADLYVRRGAPPTTSTFDCGSTSNTSDERCEVFPAQPGTYHVLVFGYTAFEEVDLSVESDPGVTGPDTTSTTPTAADGPRVSALAWGCNAGATAFTWEVATDAWVGSAWLDLFDLDPETGSYELHDLRVIQSDPAGAWDQLRAGPLADGADPAAQTANVDTRHDCGTPARTSFAIRIHGVDGKLTDCVVGGADPAGATAAVRGIDPDVVQLGQCREWVPPS